MGSKRGALVQLPPFTEMAPRFTAMGFLDAWRQTGITGLHAAERRPRRRTPPAATRKFVSNRRG